MPAFDSYVIDDTTHTMRLAADMSNQDLRRAREYGARVAKVGSRDFDTAIRMHYRIVNPYPNPMNARQMGHATAALVVPGYSFIRNPDEGDIRALGWDRGHRRTNTYRTGISLRNAGSGGRGTSTRSTGISLRNASRNARFGTDSPARADALTRYTARAKEALEAYRGSLDTLPPRTLSRIYGTALATTLDRWDEKAEEAVMDLQDGVGVDQGTKRELKALTSRLGKLKRGAGSTIATAARSFLRVVKAAPEARGE